jgi:hypothetical protein
MTPVRYVIDLALVEYRDITSPVNLKVEYM